MLRFLNMNGLPSLVSLHECNACTQLTATNLSGLQAIGEFVFCGCTSLTTVNFSGLDRVVEIGNEVRGGVG